MDTATQTGEGKAPAPRKDKSKGNSKDQDASRKLLTEKQLVEQLKEDVCEMIDQCAPVILNGVVVTDGSERASISLTASFNPGGKSSKARFDVDGKATVPAKGATHQVVIHETRSGEKQLKMFAPNA